MAQIAILYLILNLAACALLVLFIKGLIKNYKSKNLSVKNATYKAIFTISILIVVPILLVKLLPSDPELITTKERIDFHSKFKHFLALNDIYYNLIEDNPSNPNIHYNNVNSISQHIKKLKDQRSYDIDELKNSVQAKRTKHLYETYINDTDSVKQDIGRLFLSLHYLNLSKTDLALRLINEIKNTSIPYYHFALGKCLAQKKDRTYFIKADSILLLATSDSFALKEVYYERARLYYYFGQDGLLETLVNDSAAYKYIGVFSKRIVFMRSGKYFKYWQAVFRNELKFISLWGAIASFVILCLWLYYLRKLDIYEPERWVYIITTLSLGMCTIFLVYPMHDVLWDIFHLHPSKDPISSFIYMVLSIGMVEELVKIIPFLLVLRFTNAINEPFDYILYCSVSALGFAFIENLGYIKESSLYNINARALTASVAHMIFSSTIGYGLMLSKYKKLKNPIIIFFFFFILAAVMHAFYDFWLLHKFVKDYKWITTIFFLISVHIWHLYANNTLNITTFYDPKVKLENDRLKYFLIASLLGVLMFSYVINSFTQGSSYGNNQLLYSVLTYGYLLLYLSFSFSRFEIIRGYLAPISVPFNLLIPRLNRTTDYSGMPISVSTSKRFRLIKKYSSLGLQLPSTATLKRRLVIDDNLECYVAKLDKSILIDGYLSDSIAIMPKKRTKKLNESGNILVYLMLIPTNEILKKPILFRSDFEFAGWAITKRIDETDIIVQKATNNGYQ